MVTNGGNPEGLFRAAFMQSGSPVAWGDITKGQPYYDRLTQMTGCEGASDTLACLRGVSYAALTNAINNMPGVTSYQVSSTWRCLICKLKSMQLVVQSCFWAAHGWCLLQRRPHQARSTRQRRKYPFCHRSCVKVFPSFSKADQSGLFRRL